MTAPQVQTKVRPRELDQLSRALETVSGYLSDVHDAATSSDEPTTYVLDWDTLFEAVTPDRPDSHYAALMWHGLRSLKESGSDEKYQRVLLPEGTRRELALYVSQLVSTHRENFQRATVDVHSPLLNDTGLRFRAAEWQPVLQHLQDMAGVEETLDRIHSVIKEHAGPVPMRPETISTGALSHYREQLTDYRGAAESRNEADAINLATVRALDGTGSPDRGPHRLVTATRAVAASDRQITADPFRFSLDAHMRRLFPDRRSRAHTLRRMLARTYHVLCEIGDFTHDESEFSSLPSRHQARKFEEVLASLSDDVVLREIYDMVSAASQRQAADLRQAFGPDKLLLDDSLARLQDLPGKAALILDRLGEGASPDDLGLSLRRNEANAAANSFEVVDYKGRTVLEVESGSEGMILSWPTFCSFRDSATAISSLDLSAQPSTGLGLTVRLSKQTGARQTSVESWDNVCDAVTFVAGIHGIDLVQIRTPGLTYWYEFAGPPVNPSDLDMSSASRIAVQVSSGSSDVEGALEVFDKTCLHWTFPSAIKELIDRIIKSAAQEPSAS